MVIGMTNVYFITGASKGIGLALSKQLIANNDVLVCVARTKNEELIQLAEQKNCHLTFLTYDLAEATGIDALMGKMIAQIPNKANVKSITLVNNAGVVEPIGPTEKNDHEKIAASIAVNLTAPMLLTSAFIKQLEADTCAKRVVNISSGAGRKVYTGWSAYCTTKAGLDHYTRVVAEEQRNKRHGVKLVSIAPGIIDTGMQTTIRASNKADFALLDRFIAYKEENLLSTPEETARKLIELMQRDTFHELPEILDLRDF